MSKIMAAMALVFALFAVPAYADNVVVFRHKGVIIDHVARGDDPFDGGGGEETGNDPVPETGGGAEEPEVQNDDVAYKLNASVLPNATEKTFWSYNFGNLLTPAPKNMAKVEWRIDPYPGQTMPTGLSWTGANFSGSPEKWGKNRFYVVATINGKEFKLDYSLLVDVIPTYAKSLTKGFGRYALMDDGSVWFVDDYKPARVAGLESGVSAVYEGVGHTCAVKSGTAWCWGDNTYGELGNGTTTKSDIPVQVQGLDGYVTSMALGYYSTCAILDEGSVKCWGNNYYGQLGNGTTKSLDFETLPVDIVPYNATDTAELNTFVRLDIGSSHVCGITGLDRVWCWGYNSYGQLGDGTTTSRKRPIMVSSLVGNVKDIATGTNHSCAIMEAGDVHCWGDGRYGQIGNGEKEYSTPLPAAVVGLGNAARISATSDHSCTLLEDGRIKCWGNGDYGELGNGPSADSALPVLALGGKDDIIEVRALTKYSCVLDASRKIWCFGSGYTPNTGEEVKRPWEGTGSS